MEDNNNPENNDSPLTEQDGSSPSPSQHDFRDDIPSPSAPPPSPQLARHKRPPRKFDDLLPNLPPRLDRDMLSSYELDEMESDQLPPPPRLARRSPLASAQLPPTPRLAAVSWSSSRRLARRPSLASNQLPPTPRLARKPPPAPNAALPHVFRAGLLTRGLREVALIPLITLIIVSGLALILFTILPWPLIGSTMLFFICQMVFLMTTTCLIPTFTYWITKQRQRVKHIALESLFFTVLFLGYGLWLFGSTIPGIVAVYAAALILLLEAGGHFVEWYKEMTLERLSKGNSFKDLVNFAVAFEKVYHNELSVYLSVPLGLTVGTILGLLQHQPPKAIIILCLQLVLMFASLLLLYFLIRSFQRMCEPMFSTGRVAMPEITVKKRTGLLLLVWELLIPPPKPKVADQTQRDIDLACDISELRKIYKYDALHNTILLVVFVATAAHMYGATIDRIWFILGCLAAAFLLSELPYGLGQYVLHQKVLARSTGAKYAEVKKKLEEYAPLFPPWTVLAALTTATGIGGFLFFLLNLFVQSGLNIIGK